MFVFDVQQKDLSSTVALPLTSVMLQADKMPWEHPFSAPVSSKRFNHMYCVQESLEEFLFTHLWPNSLVVSSSAKGQKQQSTSPDKEGKRLDSFGWRFDSSGSLGIKCCNNLVCVACYIHAILENFLAVILFLSKDKKLQTMQLKSDSLAVA